MLQGRLGRTDAVHLAAGFKAIADPARLQLLSFVAAQPSGEACVCHLTTPLGLSQPTVSHHLKVLFEAGLLERERRGTWVYYRIVPAELGDDVGLIGTVPLVATALPGWRPVGHAATDDIPATGGGARFA